MVFRRSPAPALRPFISVVWATEGKDGTGAGAFERERVLPTGAMHLVFRLTPEPLRLFDTPDGSVATPVGHAIVGGARFRAYIRDISTPSSSVGAMLKPGAARLLFGASAAELAGRHTALEDLWGSAAERTRQRLLELREPEERLRFFEGMLLQRLPRVRGLHPAVAESLERLQSGATVRSIVADSGYSHRRFIALFEEAVGLTPKRYGRVIRLAGVLARLKTGGGVSLARLAMEAGYSDQQHLNRDFRELADLSPTSYLGAAPLDAHHVPVLSIPT